MHQIQSQGKPLTPLEGSCFTFQSVLYTLHVNNWKLQLHFDTFAGLNPPLIHEYYIIYYNSFYIFYHLNELC